MANNIAIFTERQIRVALRLDSAIIDTVEAAFIALEAGRAIMPPILSMDLPAQNAEIDVKTAFIDGFDGFAIKISPGFFDNHKLGLPNLNGMMVLLSAQTGQVRGVFLDNGYLTDLRTAAAGAVAARHLAPARVETACVLGTGAQARLQMQAAFLVRPFKRGLVWGRNDAKAAATARDLTTQLGVPVHATSDRAQMLAQAQLAITTTPSPNPIIEAAWLHPGLHITAMGSDQTGKNELDPAIVARADLYVADRLRQTEKLGELRAALAAGHPPHQSAELGAIIAKGGGRLNDSAITICDLTGTGAQDTAIANAAWAVLHGQGTIITN